MEAWDHCVGLSDVHGREDRRGIISGGVSNGVCHDEQGGDQGDNSETHGGR